MIDDTLRNTLRSLKCELSPDKLLEVIQFPQSEDIVELVLTFEEGSDGELTVNYLNDILLLLSLVSAVRECNFEQHLHAERNMIYLALLMTIKIMSIITHTNVSTYPISSK